MIEQTIVDLFTDLGHTWTVVASDGAKRTIIPDEDDVEKVLDEAVRNLYTESIGTRFNVGKLIIEKTETGYDVYCYVGYYN